MKTLLLMRHAKSSWKHPELVDHDRPLNKRGKKDAPVMGKLIQERNLVPQRIISSTAVRSRQTAESVAEASGFQGEIVYLSKLYMAEADAYLETLRNLPDEYERVMVIGHNPGLETLLQVLSGRIESLTTAVIANIRLPIEHWADLNVELTGELVDFWTPKTVRKDDDSVKGKKKKDK